MKESIAIKKRLPVNLRKTLNSHSDPSSDAEYEDFVSYFCWRMAPKLLKLPEYDSLPEPTANPCRSCIQQWKRAVVGLLSWEDNGMGDVSKRFKDFYSEFAPKNFSSFNLLLLILSHADDLLYYKTIRNSIADPIGHQTLQRQLLDVVFEAYASDPKGFRRIIREVFKIWELIPQAVQRDAQANLWNMIEHESVPAHFAVARLRTYLRSGVSNLRQQLENTRFNWIETDYNMLASSSKAKPEHIMQLPMALGLDSCALIAFETRLDQFLDEFDVTQLGPTDSHEDNVAHDDSHSAVSTENKIHLYVGPSGCGKTHRIRQLLDKHWGLYMLAGNLSPQLQSDCQQPREDQTLFDQLNYQARRSGGSRDTYTWFNDLNIHHQEIAKYELSCATLARSRIKTILHIRLCVLEDFLQAYPGCRTPPHWLNFQTSLEQSGHDIFNILFRIARFRHSQLLSMDLRTSENPTWWVVPGEKVDDRRSSGIYDTGFELIPRLASNMFICIDEAQCDLESELPDYSPDDDEIIRLGWFSPFSVVVKEAAKAVFQVMNLQSFQMAISGTALELKSTMEALTAEMPSIESSAQIADMWRRGDLHHVNPSKPFQLPENYRTQNHFQMPLLSVESDFELVEEDSQFEALLMERISDCKKELQDKIMEHSRSIIEYSKPLRGRYQWSICYLEKIKENVETDPQAFRKEAARCCQQVYDMAKDGLKRRLKEIDKKFWNDLSDILRNGGYQDDSDSDARDPAQLQEWYEELREPVDELCWLAIRSDLLGQSSIFQSKESADLLAYGFAFVERKPHGTEITEQSGQDGTNVAERIVLKERIAVEAAVEYFQAQRSGGRPSRYDEALKRSFYQEQSNVSALGKKAEVFFAWHLRKVLREPEQRMDAVLPIFSRDERMKVLNILVGGAKSLNQLFHESEHGSDANDRFEAHFGCDPDTLHLIEGAQTAFEEKNYDGRPETTWGWMKRVRKRSHTDSLTSTFWFPGNNAGPDVLFALKRTTSHHPGNYQSTELELDDSKRRRIIDNSIVLCAVQLILYKIKRQTTNHDVAGAILSTSPNHWFRHGSKFEAKSILHELKEWRTEGYPIVRILVTALTDPGKKKPKDYLKEEKNKLPTRARFREESGETAGQSSSRPDERNSENFRASEIPLDQQYFNWVGAEHDGDLFGAAFSEFNRAERNA